MLLNVNRLIELVIEKGMSYTELAIESKISKTQISRIVNSTKPNVRNTTIKSLADSLGVECKEIIEGDVK